MSLDLRTKTVAEVRNAAVDFQPRLDAGEELTGTPTVTATPSGLTFAGPAVNEETIEVNGQNVPSGKGVLFRVSGGAARKTYQIKVTCTTDAVPAQTLVEYCTLKVQA